MEPITIVKGRDLAYLLGMLGIEDATIYRIRFHQTGNGEIKIKVNENTWTPGLGELDVN